MIVADIDRLRDYLIVSTVQFHDALERRSEVVENPDSKR